MILPPLYNPQYIVNTSTEVGDDQPLCSRNHHNIAAADHLNTQIWIIINHCLTMKIIYHGQSENDQQCFENIKKSFSTYCVMQSEH